MGKAKLFKKLRKASRLEAQKEMRELAGDITIELIRARIRPKPKYFPAFLWEKIVF